MQAWRSRLLPTYPPLNRPNLPNTTLANSNSSTTPSRGLRPAKRARSRGRCGPPEETSAMVAVADLSLLAYPRRSSSPRCPGCLRRGSPYPRSRGWETLGSKLFPKCPPPAISGRPFETRQEGISTRPFRIIRFSRREPRRASKVRRDRKSWRWPSPRGQRQGRALLGEKR